MRAFKFLVLATCAAALAVDEKPITKVVNLLKDMQAELEKEQAADEDLYEQIACWCETNDKGKTGAIDTANERNSDASALIEEMTAKGKQLDEQIEQLKSDVAEKTESLEKSTKIREKEAAEFHTDEMNMMQSIGNLKAAVITLSKTQGGALTQESLLQVRQMLRHQHSQYRRMLVEGFSAEQHQRLISLLQREDTTAAASYEPASGAIFGIIKQMKETFETNLVKSQEDEAKAKEDFKEMKGSKSEEISAAEDLIDTQTVELAAANKKNSDSKEELDDTTAALAADTKFLADLKGKCAAVDKQWAERSKARTDEITALSETLEILTGDEARDLAAKTTLLQMRSRTHRMTARDRAAAVLRKASRQTGSLPLALLAVSVQEDVFAKVRENIDKLIGELKATQQDEVKQKDFCRQEFHENEMQTTEKTDLKEDTMAKIESLENSIKALKEALAALKQQIADMHVEIKRAGENRQKENKDFQVTVADQRAMQAILKKAMARMKQFYDKKALLQMEPGAAVPAMPAGFQPLKKSGGAAGIVAILEHIIDEAVSLEKEALQEENDGQAAYGEFLSDSNASITAMQQEISDKTKALADADQARVQAQADLNAVVDELEQLAQYNAKLHADCDYLIKNFEARQEGRTAEIEALQSAKQIFAQGR